MNFFFALNESFEKCKKHYSEYFIDDIDEEEEFCNSNDNNDNNDDDENKEKQSLIHYFRRKRKNMYIEFDGFYNYIPPNFCSIYPYLIRSIIDEENIPLAYGFVKNKRLIVCSIATLKPFIHHRNGNKYLNIDAICSNKNLEKKGYGQILLNKIYQICKNNEIVAICVKSVNEVNTLKFYMEKNAFVKNDEYTDDDDEFVHLIKHLPPNNDINDRKRKRSDDDNNDDNNNDKKAIIDLTTDDNDDNQDGSRNKPFVIEGGQRNKKKKKTTEKKKKKKRNKKTKKQKNKKTK
jgi:hypothetical protein